MTIEELKRRKTELGLSNREIAEKSGVAFGTVQKIFSGGTKAPRYDTMTALWKLLGQEQGNLSDMPLKQEDLYDTQPKVVRRLREAGAFYGATKKQGAYTVDDYYALPEEIRVELIDGVLYDMASPPDWHQLFVGKLYAVLLEKINVLGEACMPFLAPVDVQLDRDNKTMVQPDVFVLCDLSKRQRGIIYGAPDFIIEVLSKSTKKKDMGLKLYKYAKAGVREYWIVDYRSRKVLQYDLEHNMEVHLYGFDMRVPVLISEGRCSIDLGEIERFYLDRGIAPYTDE